MCAKTMTWTLQCLSCNFIALLEAGMILTSLVITVAVVMPLCPTPFKSPREDINSPRGRATFHQNPQYSPKNPNIPLRNPYFPHKLSHKIPTFPQQTSNCSPKTQFSPVTNAPKFSIFQPRFLQFPADC